MSKTAQSTPTATWRINPCHLNLYMIDKHRNNWKPSTKKCKPPFIHLLQQKPSRMPANASSKEAYDVHIDEVERFFFPIVSPTHTNNIHKLYSHEPDSFVDFVLACNQLATVHVPILWCRVDGCTNCDAAADVCQACDTENGYEVSGTTCCNTKEDSYPDGSDSCGTCASLLPSCPTSSCSYSNDNLLCNCLDSHFWDGSDCRSCPSFCRSCSS